jgi:2-oxoglutarate ferredoxin oxidoreductase subunit alpha
MRCNIVFGGKAGQGPNVLTEVVSEGLIKKGFYVFYSRDYQSLIRGGHNFNLLSFSDTPLYSNSSKIDILVCLDKNTLGMHKKDLKNRGIILKGEEENMFFAGALYRILGIDFKIIEDRLRKLKNYEENIKHARKGYENEKRTLKLPELNNPIQNSSLINGSQAISLGAVNSGLDYYYAYPMTPATPVLTDLSQMQLEKNTKHKTIELENEIAVIIAGLGSSITGKKVMVGSSGGGFDLMTEGLSMAGQAEIPIVIYLSSRPGPGTGVATYTSQGELNLALYSGHGEFSRLVLAPGDPKECKELTNQAFFFSQKYRVPSIVLTDKHLAEAKYLIENNPKILPIENSITSMERYNSYEHDENEKAIATEDKKIIKKNFERRMKKQEEINGEAESFEMFKVYGKQSSKNLIIGWGSTKGAILDAITEGKIDAKFLQILYMEPFSRKIKSILEEARKIVIVENNSTSPLSGLIAQKTGIIINDKNKILRYDGRPFFSDELAKEIKGRLG